MAVNLDADVKTVQKTVTRSVLLLLLGLAVLGGVIGMAIHLFLKNQASQSPADPADAPSAYAQAELVSCTFWTGGGMAGGHRGYDLYAEHLIVSEQEMWNSREVHTKYPVEPSALAHAKELMLQYRLDLASERPLSEDQMLDGDTSHLSFLFSDGTDFSVNSEQDLTDMESEGFWAMQAYLKSLAAGEGEAELEPMKLAWSLDGYTFTFLLNESVAAHTLIQCFSEAALENYGENGKCFPLDEAPDISDCPLAESGEAGVLAYDASRRYAVVFFAPFTPEPGLYALGTLRDPHDWKLETIRELGPGPYSFYLEN